MCKSHLICEAFVRLQIIQFLKHGMSLQLIDVVLSLDGDRSGNSNCNDCSNECDSK